MKPGHFVLYSAIALTAACKIQVEPPASGSVSTLSGSMNCATGDSCSLDVADIHFDETFVATPAAGFIFDRWKSGTRRICAGQSGPCQYSTADLEDNDQAIALLNNQDQLLYADPSFISTGFVTLFTGNSFVAPMASGMPDLTVQAGIAHHDHSAITAGGFNGSPDALWDDPTRGNNIRAKLDAGNIEIFTMTSLPATLDGYRVWIDYALAQNPDTRIVIKAPWMPNPASFDTAGYEAQWESYHSNLHDRIDTLRSEYPGVEIFCVAYGQGAVELRNLFAAGELEDVDVLTSKTQNAIFTDSLGHADDIHRDLNRLIWLRAFYNVDLPSLAYDPGYSLDLKALAQAIVDGHDEAYDADYR